MRGRWGEMSVLRLLVYLPSALLFTWSVFVIWMQLVLKQRHGYRCLRNPTQTEVSNLVEVTYNKKLFSLFHTEAL